jgi:indolepyruvate ferredoxin oxidoreductase alpha subunit
MSESSKSKEVIHFMNQLDLASNIEGNRLFLMGNQALARGAIEADARFVTGYPGTPSSEVIESILPVAKSLGIRAEWAVNEKVALEVAAGVAFTGLRSLVTMKSAGLNVAADSLLSIAYSGVDGGFVVYVADDPSCHSGMEEQDSRFYANLSLLPMLEPSNPQEAKDAIVEAFQISEMLKLPIILRLTTRIAHSSANVRLNQIRKIGRKPAFKKDVRRHTRASPIWCMEQHQSINNRIHESKRVFEQLFLNRFISKGEEEFGIVATGVTWNYAIEAVEQFRLDNVALLKIGVANPLPDILIKKLLNKRKAVLVLEELEPYIELNVKAIASEQETGVVIHGKMDGTTPRVGEFSHETVRKAIGKLLRKDFTSEMQPRKAEDVLSVREIQFCPGCPHAGTYLAINQALNRLRLGKEGAIVTGDIGCTIVGMNKPFESCWTEICMGASISVAAGLRYSGIEKPILATIGDSTFFHNGLQALINLVLNNTRVVVVVLDNQITAMTGQQPSPSNYQKYTGDYAKPIKIEEISGSFGVEFVRVVDPFNLKATTEAMIEAINFEGPSVVVSRRSCALDARRRKIIERAGWVDPQKCTGCLACIKLSGCPALAISSDKKVVIDESQCGGCTICASICPYHAITPGRWKI